MLSPRSLAVELTEPARPFVLSPSKDGRPRARNEAMRVSPTKYVVVFERAGDGWSAYAPDLPGCIAAGKTREETERLMREAIEFHLEGLREDGEPIPEPSAWTAMVEVA